MITQEKAAALAAYNEHRGDVTASGTLTEALELNELMHAALVACQCSGYETCAEVEDDLEGWDNEGDWLG